MSYTITERLEEKTPLGIILSCKVNGLKIADRIDADKSRREVLNVMRHTAKIIVAYEMKSNEDFDKWHSEYDTYQNFLKTDKVKIPEFDLLWKD